METVVIDDRAYEVEFAGFDRPLRGRVRDEAEAGIGAGVTLAPWSLGRHLAALRRHLRTGGPRREGLGLDRAGYADEVLAEAGVVEAERARWRPLALWWALGLGVKGEPLLPPVEGEPGVELGRGLRAVLRRWTWGERLGVLRETCVEVDGEIDFDVVGYVEAMLRMCLVRIDAAVAPASAPGALDAQAGRRLVEAVIALNHPESDLRDVIAALPPSMAAATVKLCAVTGWLPGQVLAMPAAEVERMLALIERSSPASSAVSRREVHREEVKPVRGRSGLRPSRVADHPDAVVLVFDDGPETEGG